MAATTGIRKRHTAGCPGAEDEKRCSCNAGYEASAYDKHTGKKRRKTFARKSEAKTWRADMMGVLAKGGPAPAPAIAITKVPTLKAAWGEWLAAARVGTIRNRSRRPFKPATLRRYDQAMRLHLLPSTEAIVSPRSATTRSRISPTRWSRTVEVRRTSK